MTQSRKSLGSRPDELLGKLLAAIGKSDSDSIERYALVEELKKIEGAYSERRRRPTSGSHHKLLWKFRANTARRRELRRQLRPIYDDIVIAGYLRANPGADEGELRAALLDSTESIDPAEIEAIEDQDIAFLIDSAGDYRKRQVRKQVVEPFLRFLEKNEVVPSRDLPRTRMMRALFDWLGIEQTLRPTDAGIRTIARDLHKKG
jgi:hypothetical protein